ncbi:hypothetical protein GOFOIKOB_5606 [Methylobacterium tardum]|uniref:Uncharacterized protein n=1 Tax=Methylobacterium tardum TaxID=374432 RepID=A0AA37TBF6_9HYPH|nr:hypothetical protein [Methylobacterium tardum]URD34616.1 hypothetical protein M6G65_18645 [Methylobacterium tardum]GJE52533.1 hypothetical protein GOFOIKOB_5606 [Methylobacterium tardum]GLS68063.1 hypothetical protein GCM10007890_00740 [Methylobacterium tardum]
MKERNPAFEVVSRMEDDVASVARWAEVLGLLGSTPHMIDPSAIHAIAEPIRDIGKRLNEQWSEAFDIVAGRR